MFDITVKTGTIQEGKKFKDTRENLLKEFAYLVKDQYIEDLINYIDTRRYRSDWRDIDLEDLHIRGLSKLTRASWKSLVRDSLSVAKFGEIYKIGVDPIKKFERTNIPMMTIIRRVEFGTSTSPARPLYSIVSSTLSRKVPIYWSSYLSEKEEVDDRHRDL